MSLTGFRDFQKCVKNAHWYKKTIRKMQINCHVVFCTFIILRVFCLIAVWTKDITLNANASQDSCKLNLERALRDTEGHASLVIATPIIFPAFSVGNGKQGVIFQPTH
jgi:hypothetical protein